MDRLDRSARRVLVCTVSTNALVFFDQTAVTVALPAIGRDFAAGTDDLQWVISAYLLALAALMVVAGRLADVWGLRRTFLTALALFGLGSACCALAPTLPLLVAARFAQGVGGAVLAPLALSATVAAVGDRRRGWAIGVLSTGGTSLLVLGPLLAGPLVTGSWRWVFAVNLPVVLLAAVTGAGALPAPSARSPRTVDPGGLALLLGGLTAVVVALVAAVDLRWWASALGLAGVALLAVFARRETRRADPLVDLRALGDPLLAGSLVALFAVQFAVFGLTVPLTLYLQHQVGLGAAGTGAVVALAGLGTPLLSLRTGRLADRLGPKRLVLPGLVLATAGLAGVAVLVRPDSFALLLPGLVLFALARPLVFSPAGTGPFLALGPGRRADAAGLATEARQIGAVLGVAFTTATALGAGRSTALAAGGTGHLAGFRAAVLVATGVCALAAIVVWLYMPGAAPTGRPLPDPDPTPRTPPWERPGR